MRPIRKLMATHNTNIETDVSCFSSAMKLTALAFATIVLLASSAPAQTSFYTDLAPAKCRTLEVDKETGSSTQRCAGVGGYRLLVHDDDSRQSITVVDPSGKRHDLNFWHVITGGFSSLGAKAEWRMTSKRGRRVPYALIVRVNANEDAENPNRVRSYLSVTKLTAESVCVTHKLEAVADSNEAARKAADEAANAPCLKDATP